MPVLPAEACIAYSGVERHCKLYVTYIRHTYVGIWIYIYIYIYADICTCNICITCSLGVYSLNVVPTLYAYNLPWA